MTVEYIRTRRRIGAAHLPKDLVQRILNVLPPADARLLANLLNQQYQGEPCYFLGGRWNCDPHSLPRERA